MRATLVAAIAAVLAIGSPTVRCEIRAEPEVQPARDRVTEAAARPAPTPVEVRLDAFSPPRKSAAATLPPRIGFPRDVASLEDPDRLAARLEWSREAGGARAAIRVSSPGATAIRLGLRVERLPPGARLRFQGGEARAHAVEAGRIPLGRTWWSPVVEGEDATMTIELAPGTDPAAVRLAIPSVSHLVAGASTGFVPKASSHCEVDAACATSWRPESNAVVRIVFTEGGVTSTCSAVLVADRDGATSVPHLVTARHCLHTDQAAESVQAYWFYRAAACDLGGVDPAYQVTTGGGVLLYESTQTDTTLVRLNDTPPVGAIYAGWIVGAGPLGEGTPVTALHHPSGDLQKVSRGEVRGFFDCVHVGTDPLAFDCDPAMPRDATFYAIGWTSGTIEGGSSGGGIFSDDGHYLLGQVYGGNGSCTSPAWTFAGRFDVAYESGLGRWLGPPDRGAVTRHAAEAAPLYEVSDLWWNPAESGWGLALNQHGTTVFGAWFAYDAQGIPRWLVMPGGTWTDERTFTGDLYTTTGPDGLGEFDPARVTRRRIGVATLVFSSRDSAVLSYTVEGESGSKAITRQPFGPPNSIGFGTFGDLWWNPAESGWGLSVSQQFGTLFAVWYTYGPDGRPAWYVLPDGRWTSGETYSGTLYRTSAAAAPFFGRPFDPAAVQRHAVGILTLRFNGPGTGTMSYTVDGVSGTREITRQPF